MGCRDTSNGENEAPLKGVAKKSLCPEEVAFRHVLQCQET